MYSIAQGTSGALSVPSVFEKAVKGDGSKTMLVEHEQPKEQILSAQKSLDELVTNNSLK